MSRRASSAQVELFPDPPPAPPAPASGVRVAATPGPHDACNGLVADARPGGTLERRRRHCAHLDHAEIGWSVARGAEQARCPAGCAGYTARLFTISVGPQSLAADALGIGGDL